MNPLDLLLWSLLTAFGATGLTIILRNAPIIRRWVFDLRKPWACNVCMPLYTIAVVLLVTPTHLRGWASHALVFLAAYLLSHLILEVMSRPPASGPPTIPRLLDLDDTEDTKDAD